MHGLGAMGQLIEVAALDRLGDGVHERPRSASTAIAEERVVAGFAEFLECRGQAGHRQHPRIEHRHEQVMGLRIGHRRLAVRLEPAVLIDAEFAETTHRPIDELGKVADDVAGV